MAVPVTVPKQCFTTAYKTEHPDLHAAADLTITAFYYLLRVGEYTKPRMVKKDNRWVKATRKVRFAIRDKRLFKNVKIIDKTNPLDTLLAANSVTLNISS